jgi:signal peptidase I
VEAIVLRWAKRVALLPLVAVPALALVWLGLTVTGHEMMVVKSGSMTPTLAAGDIAIVSTIAPAQARPGDVVSFHDPSRNQKVVTHRVVETSSSAGAVAFITKGDRNTGTERWSTPADGTIGRLSFRVPALGRVLVAVASPTARAGLIGLLFLTLGAVGLRLVWRMGTAPLQPALLAVTAVLGLLVGARALPSTLSANSSVTSNENNTFAAAAAFCTGSLQTVQASADASVKEASPTTNYETEANLFVKTSTTDNKRALVTFPLPTIPAGCEVTGASLRMFETTVQGTRTFTASQLAGAWTESGVTWDNQPSTTGTPATVSNALGWRYWNVTTMVTNMYSGSNHGFVIKDQTENGGTAFENRLTSRAVPAETAELVVSFGDSACGSLTVERIETTADASVKESIPTTNFGNDNDVLVKSKLGDNKRGFVNFTLPALNGCEVTGATLRMYLTTTQGTRTIEVRGAASSWTEAGITWNNQPAANGTAVTTTNVPDWREWNVGPIVTTMYGGTSFGFVVRDQSEDDALSFENKFASREVGPVAELIVGYEG